MSFFQSQSPKNFVLRVDTDYNFSKSQITDIFYNEYIGDVLRIDEFISIDNKNHYIYIVYFSELYKNYFTQYLISFLKSRWNIRYSMSVKMEEYYYSFYISLIDQWSEIEDAIESYENFKNSFLEDLDSDSDSEYEYNSDEESDDEELDDEDENDDEFDDEDESNTDSEEEENPQVPFMY